MNRPRDLESLSIHGVPPGHLTRVGREAARAAHQAHLAAGRLAATFGGEHGKRHNAEQATTPHKR